MGAEAIARVDWFVVATPRLALLLPPSEGKAEGGARPRWAPSSGTFGSELGSRREQLAAALAAVGGGDERLLGVGGKHLLRARSVNSSLLGSPTLQAAERYTGVVWDHLDLASMESSTRQRAGTSVVVISGLLGVVSLLDRIPDYRLKMGAGIEPFGKLSTWWRPAVNEALDQWARGRFVVDLLPIEHRAAWQPGEKVRGVSVTFVERNGKSAGHDAKAAKGRLARHLLESELAPLVALATWRDARFDLAISSLR